MPHSLLITGGTAPYTVVLTGGSLPPGLSLATTGVISGTPTTAGTYAFAAEVTDADSNTDTVSCSITISAEGSPAEITGYIAVSSQPSFQASGWVAVTGAMAVSSQPSFQASGNVGSGGLGVETVEIDCSISVFGGSPVSPGTCLWIDLWVWRQLTTFDSLSTNVQLAPGYEKALTLALAAAVASEYRRLPHPKVLELAAAARKSIEALNSSNHVAQEDPPEETPNA